MLLSYKVANANTLFPIVAIPFYVIPHKYLKLFIVFTEIAKVMKTSAKPMHWHYSSKRLKLVVEKYEQRLDFSSIRTLKEIELADPDYSPRFPLLSDIRQSSPQFSYEDLLSYKAFMQIQLPKLMQNRRLAILTDSPMQVAVASLFKSHTIDMPQETEIFSTLEAALRWLDRLEYQKEVTKLLAKGGLKG